MPLHRSFRKASLLLVLPLLLNSAVPAFALKQQEFTESAGVEEIKEKFLKPANTTGLIPQPSSIAPVAPVTSSITAAGAEEAQEIRLARVRYDSARAALQGAEVAKAGEDILSPLRAELESAAGQLRSLSVHPRAALLRVVVADEMDETKLGMKGVVNASSLPKEEKIKRIIALKPQVLIVRSATQVDKSLIDHLPDLRDVIRGGHGTDNVDTAYAQSKGKRVRKSEGSEDSVAALAMRMVARARAIQTHSEAENDETPPALFTLHDWMQAVEKKMKKVSAEDRPLFERKANELFRPIGKTTINSLRGQRLGIIGFGVVGKQIAAVAKGLGMEVRVYAPSLEADPTPAQRLGVLFATKEEIYRSSHYIVLITGLYTTGSRKNVGMVNQAVVEAMLQNKGLIALVNPDREELVDEAAVRRLMTEGKVQYWVDEAPKDEYLREHSIYANHIGASTIQAEAKVVANVAAILGELSAEAGVADAAGAEEKLLPRAEGVRFLLNNTNPKTVVELAAPYNRPMPMSELPTAGKMGEVLRAVMQAANVDGLFMILVPETNTVRVEPPPTDPDRPRWSWPIAQALVRYEELTVSDQPLQQAVGNFPRPDKVRELLSSRPVPAAQVRAALQQLRQETDTLFDTARRGKKFPPIYYSRPDNVQQVLTEAIQAVPSPLENVRRAGLNLIQAALDYNAPLRIFGSDASARSPSGVPVPLLNARRLLQSNPNVVLVELEQEGSGALVLQSRQPRDTDDRLGISALILEVRLQRLLAGRPRALVSLMDIPLTEFLKALRERGNWESLKIVHEDNPALPPASIAVTQGNAERQFNLSFEQAVPSPEDRESMVFDLSVFQRPDNRVQGKIVLRRSLPAAGAEEQERAGREFISRYLAILPANSSGATRREAIQRLVEASAEVSLAGRIKEDSAAGFVHLEFPLPLPDVLFEESGRLRPPQVLYDRAAGELYVYTEWGLGKDRKSGLTPVFTHRRVLELTAQEGTPGTITISSERIRNGEIVLLVPKTAPFAGPSAAGVEGIEVPSPADKGRQLVRQFQAAGELEPLPWIEAVAAATLLGKEDSEAIFLIPNKPATSQHPIPYVTADRLLPVGVENWALLGQQKNLQVTLRRGSDADLSELYVSAPVTGLKFKRVIILDFGFKSSAAGAEQTFEVAVENVENLSVPGGVPLQAVRIRLQKPLDLNIGTIAGLYPNPTQPPVLTAFRSAAVPQDNSFFAMTDGKIVLGLEPTATKEYTNRLTARALEQAIQGSLPPEQAALPVRLGRYRNLRVDMQSPAEISAGMKLKIAFRPQVDSTQNPLKEAATSPYKLIFRPENAGLALLLGRQEVEARIVVGSEKQENVLLEFRPDLAGSIVPGYKFTSIDLAVEIARLALGPDATEVREILDPRDRAVLWNQIETWLHPFPWKSFVTLEDALLNNVANVLGA